MDNQPRRHHEAPKKRGIAKYVTLFLLALVVLAGGYAARLYSQTKNAIDATYSPVTGRETSNSSITGKKPISILLMGTDTGALGRTDKGRTDTMIVVTINPKTKKTTMVSIPRDTYTQIVGSQTQDKINAAYTYGGTETALKTVEKLLNVPINYYVLVNMSGLEKIVDAVGGVDVNVKFSWTDPQHVGNYKFTKGPMHLNGAQALAYARMRYVDPQGDYGRQVRQQEVITQIVKKALSASSLSNYQQLMTSLASSMRTDLQFDDIVAIGEKYRNSAKNFKRYTLQGTGVYINGASCQIPSTSELQKLSNRLRTQMELPDQTIDNFNTQQNAKNTANGFDFGSGANPQYTIYNTDSSGGTGY